MARSESRIALHDQENFLPKRDLVLAVITLGVILLVINIDHNGLSTLLPTIAQDIHAEKSITWAGSSALVATTVFSVLYGRLSDIFGRKALFVSVLAVFAVAELACGFAVNPPMLYALRALTGASGGGAGNLATIIATDVVSLRDRGQYMAFIAPFMVGGNICGPLLAAAFIKSPLGWRGLFWFISPLGGLAALLAAYMLPSTTPTDSFRKNVAKVDWLGSLTSTIAIVTFMVPVSGAGSYFSWNSPIVIALLSVSGVATIAFLVVEWRVAALPIIPLTLFTKLDVCALLMQTFTLGWINQTNVYFIPLYAQILREWSPVVSSLLLLPIVAIQVIVSMLAGRWMSKSGQYGTTIRFGVICLLTGSLLETWFDRGSGPGLIVLALLLIGIGVGAANQPMAVAMQAHTKKSERAVVTSARNFFRFLGAASGVGVSSAILQYTLRSSLPTALKHLADSPYSLGHLDKATRDAVSPVYEKALARVLIGSVGAAAICASGLLAWRDEGYEARPDEGLPEPHEGDAEEDALIPSTDAPSFRPSYGALGDGGSGNGNASKGVDRKQSYHDRPGREFAKRTGHM
ncbi:hypothetical protein DOTSEDRAFT_192184 [Dothistroma septosporum NZE10]|uniref:Major facilitator superfamily (MFS) profile domain-containing protein n=1 Tax=Dothistroma septosporum (strain NZE10 / CBS 128990) TaxID=675120 RepID=N1PKV5_DOTSN|nr:hypothetical protein DOTSEDRAFT_192184 [Dothistroma septosporum NZE10]